MMMLLIRAVVGGDGCGGAVGNENGGRRMDSLFLEGCQYGVRSSVDEESAVAKMARV